MPRSITTVKEDLAHKQRCAQDLIDRAEKENRVTTAEENTLFDKQMSDVETLKAEMAALQEHDRRRTSINDLRKEFEESRRVTSPTAVAKPNPTDFDGTLNRYRRDGKLHAFTGANAEERAYRSGMWARAFWFNDVRAQNWCVNHGIDIRNAQGENVNSAGGYLVPDEFSQAIIDLREQYGVARQNVQIMPMGRDTMLIPRRAGGITIAPIGENPTSAIGQSQASWNNVRLVAKKFGGLTLMSTEIAEDAIISLADWLAREFAYGFALFEDQCLFLGDGTSTYAGIRGLANILVAGTLISAQDAATGHDTLPEIDAADLTKCMSVLPAYARRNAKWFCSAAASDLVFGRLMAAAGGNNIQTIMGGYGLSYLGYPIVISQLLPASGTINDVPILYFGDLNLAVTMGDRRQVTVFPSEHRYMDTDQIGIRATERFDIVVHDYGDTTVAGPIVALVGNT